MSLFNVKVFLFLDKLSLKYEHFSMEEVLELRECSSWPVIPRVSWWGVRGPQSIISSATSHSLGTSQRRKDGWESERRVNMNYECLCCVGGDGWISPHFSLIGKKLCSVSNSL